MANSATFSFTMNNRYVDGQNNKMLHTLDAGDLTISGDIWIVSKKARTASEPDSVSFALVKIGILNTTACDFSVVPSKIFNKKVPFSRSCGHVESGTYFLTVSKSEAFDKAGDGWQSQGSGTITTK